MVGFVVRVPDITPPWRPVFLAGDRPILGDWSPHGVRLERHDDGTHRTRLDLPPGYSMEWGGEHEDSARARASVFRPVPYFLAIMVFICVCLFNSIRSTLLMWLIMPLAIVGVTAGLLLTNMPFTFMALLGVLSLGGELIKMQIVVLSKILAEIDRGKAPYRAILDGATTKVRPVCMVVFTTVLGMIPLLKDPFFGAMAAGLMFGLAFATVLCLIVTPVLYAIFFNVREEAGPAAEVPPKPRPDEILGVKPA